MKTKSTRITFILLLSFTLSYAQPGSLDLDFDADGKVLTDINTGIDLGLSVAVQPDGKIVVAWITENGADEIAVLRYLSDGKPDNSFGSGGMLTTSIDNFTDTRARHVLLQEDGKIVVSGRGSDQFAIVRFNEDGGLDNSFDTDGIVTTQVGVVSYASCCAIQPDGLIVAAGSGNTGTGPEFGLARYISGSNLEVISFSKQDHGLLIYPNPLQERTTIEYTLTDDEIISIALYDISGSLIQSFVRSKKRNKGAQKEILGLDASIPPGNYILTLSNGIGSSSMSVIE